MRIVNREAFITLPAGTLFQKYKPAYFEPIAIKGESIIWGSGSDFSVQSLDTVSTHSSRYELDALYDAEHGEPFSFDFELEGRDGCFDDDQLFAVWEPDDVKALIKRLQGALRDSGGDNV